MKVARKSFPRRNQQALKRHQQALLKIGLRRVQHIKLRHLNGYRQVVAYPTRRLSGRRLTSRAVGGDDAHNAQAQGELCQSERQSAQTFAAIIFQFEPVAAVLISNDAERKEKPLLVVKYRRRDPDAVDGAAVAGKSQSPTKPARIANGCLRRR